MFHLLGLVLQGAHFEFLLFGVPGVALALGGVRNDDLDVGLHALGARVHQLLLLHHAAVVDEQAGVDVVDGIHDEALRIPECVVINVFGVFRHYLPLGN